MAVYIYNSTDSKAIGSSQLYRISSSNGADFTIGGSAYGSTIINDASGSGNDVLDSSVTTTMGPTLLGKEGDDTLIGSGTPDQLFGGSGNDTLEGKGGDDRLYGQLGNDSLDGGEGTDLALYFSAANQFTVTRAEAPNRFIISGSEGTDQLSNIEYIQFADAAPVLIESLVSPVITGTADNDSLSGTAGDDIINGLAGNDALNGLAGNDTLDGGLGNDILNGGLGADTLLGGLGNDTYYVDNTGDVVTENTGAGTDTVNSSITYTLGTNLENLTLTGTTALDGTGSALNNILTGNAAANTLNGGAGADKLIGGLGNDTYFIDNASDIVTETSTLATEIDTVNSSITYTLGANVEKLTLTGVAVINSTGNALNNTLTGNASANILSGFAGNDTINGGGNDLLIGGAGKDTLTGGLGNDIFDFNAYSEMGLGASARDVITDFVRGQDRIDLSSIDPNVALPGDQAFKVITTAFNAPGQIHYSGGIISLNTDSDAATEYEIQLTGVIPTTLAATDFVL